MLRSDPGDYGWRSRWEAILSASDFVASRRYLVGMQQKALACVQCGHQSYQWLGRCPECLAWDSFAEVAAAGPLPAAMPISEVEAAPKPRIPTGLKEVDQVLGGGLVPGTATLLAGEPGVGKSTLMLQLASAAESEGRSVIYFSGEESSEQVASRARRLGSMKTRVSEATRVTDISALMAGADVAIVDSVQTAEDPSSPGEPGSVSQVRSSAAALVRAARASGAALLLVGQICKDGSIAGPRALEHVSTSCLRSREIGGRSCGQ